MRLVHMNEGDNENNENKRIPRLRSRYELDLWLVTRGIGSTSVLPARRDEP